MIQSTPNNHVQSISQSHSTENSMAQHTNRQVDQCSRRPHIYSCLIFDKITKIYTGGEKTSLTKGDGKLMFTNGRTKLDPVSITLHNNNSKWVKDFNVKPDS